MWGVEPPKNTSCGINLPDIPWWGRGYCHCFERPQQLVKAGWSCPRLQVRVGQNVCPATLNVLHRWVVTVFWDACWRARDRFEPRILGWLMPSRGQGNIELSCSVVCLVRAAARVTVATGGTAIEAAAKPERACRGSSDEEGVRHDAQWYP